MAQDGQSVIAENGPMRLVIQAWKEGIFLQDLSLAGAAYAFSCLEQVAAHQPLLKTPAASLPESRVPHIVYQMIRSAHATGDPELTPMAAVAGSIADAVADWLFSREAAKVIVNNGGDVSVRLLKNQKARVGIRTDLSKPAISHVLKLDARHSSWGITTSGLGGRSLTQGIASAATVVADKAAFADAAATSIANACYHPDKTIIRVPANTLDPHTDIPDLPVTLQPGNPSPQVYEKALSNALKRAESYVAKGIIFGALIAAGGQTTTTKNFQNIGSSFTPFER